MHKSYNPAMPAVIAVLYEVTLAAQHEHSTSATEA